MSENMNLSFTDRDDEIRDLILELQAVREQLREANQRLRRIDRRVAQAFPSLAGRPTQESTSRKKPKSDEQPTLTVEVAHNLYRGWVEKVKSGHEQEVHQEIGKLILPDLKLMVVELGLPGGNRKSTRKSLTESIARRLRESAMLTHHTPRRPNASDSGEGGDLGTAD